MRMSLSLFQTEGRNRRIRLLEALWGVRSVRVFALTLAVEGEAPGGVGFLSEVCHSPAASISTTRDHRRGNVLLLH